MDKEIVVYSYSGTLLNNKNEQTTDITWINLDIKSTLRIHFI